MTQPSPPPDYAIRPDVFEQGIDRYLAPVIDDLVSVSASYSSAHEEVAAAHADETPGWFGGEGNGEVRPATSSFLNEVRWQLQQLAGEQAELLASLREYEAFLRSHIKWARDTDAKTANNFHAIHQQLLEGR